MNRTTHALKNNRLLIIQYGHITSVAKIENLFILVSVVKAFAHYANIFRS